MQIFNRFRFICIFKWKYNCLHTHTHAHTQGRGRFGECVATIQKSDSFKSVMYGKTFHVKRKKQFTFTKFPFHLVFFYAPIRYEEERRPKRERERERGESLPACSIETQNVAWPAIVLFYLGKQNSCLLFCLARLEGLSPILRPYTGYSNNKRELQPGRNQNPILWPLLLPVAVVVASCQLPNAKAMTLAPQHNGPENSRSARP